MLLKITLALLHPPAAVYLEAGMKKNHHQHHPNLALLTSGMIHALLVVFKKA